LSQEQLARCRETPVITACGVQAADATQNRQQRRGNCDDVRMEYRYPASRRVADSLVSLFPLLVSALMVAGAVRFFSDPSANSQGLAGWLSLSSSSRWCSCTALHCPRRGGGRRDGLDWWPAKGPRRSPGPGPPRTLPARSSPRLSSAPAQDVIEGPATDSTPGLDPRARPHGDPDPFGRCGHLDHLSDHRDASLARMSRH